MCSTAPSVVSRTTSPRSCAKSLGSFGSATVTATRGSRRMLRTFWCPSTVLMMTNSPSVST